MHDGQLIDRCKESSTPLTARGEHERKSRGESEPAGLGSHPAKLRLSGRGPEPGGGRLALLLLLLLLSSLSHNPHARHGQLFRSSRGRGLRQGGRSRQGLVAGALSPLLLARRRRRPAASSSTPEDLELTLPSLPPATQSPRFKGLIRTWSPEDVVSKRGTLQPSYPSAVQGKKLHKLLEERFSRGEPSHTYGACVLLSLILVSSLVVAPGRGCRGHAEEAVSAGKSGASRGLVLALPALHSTARRAGAASTSSGTSCSRAPS